MFFWPSQSPISCALPAPVGTARVDVKFEQSRYHGLHALKAGDFAPPPFDGFAFVYVRPALSRIGGNAGLTRITASRFAVDYVTNLCASWRSGPELVRSGQSKCQFMSGIWAVSNYVESLRVMDLCQEASPEGTPTRTNVIARTAQPDEANLLICSEARKIASLRSQ